MSYERRDIEIWLTLTSGTFDNQNGNVLKIKGMKCQLSISAFGGATGTTLDLRLYGLSLENMAKLTSKSQRIIAQQQNLVKIIVNDETLFIGTIVASQIDLNQMPDAPINITANAVGYERTIPCNPTSINGVAKAADLVSSLAKQAGFAFKNVNVDATISNPHFEGDAIWQINEIAVAGGFNVDTNIGTVTIFKDKAYIDSVIPFVSPEHGLIGYPIFYDFGINFTSAFSSTFRIGRKCQLETSLPNGSGEYLIQAGTTHYLSSWTEGGPWFTVVIALPVDSQTSGSISA